MLTEVNTIIMEGNAETVEFNKSHLATNAWSMELIESGVKAAEATSENTVKLIDTNAKRIKTIQDRAAGNSGKHAAVLEQAMTNNAKILENSAKILERRDQIQ